MSASDAPALVHRDIREAVDSAIQFGVSAADFKALAAIYWDSALADKRKRDAEEFSK
jgi:hypothetical protein